MRNLFLLLLFVCQLVMADPHHETLVDLAPGYGDLEFTLPEPGSYDLPGLGKAVDAKVLSSDGKKVSLHGLMKHKFTLLSFIYTRCSDVNGCPLASYVIGKVQQQILKDDVLKDHVRLISISFDPANDTPEVMEEYASHFREPASDWYFVTSRNEDEMASILENYNQFIIREFDELGNPLGSISHMLRVYLIDHQYEIRNIYSVSYLHADTIMNDIRTIVMDVNRKRQTQKSTHLKTRKEEE